MKKLLTSLWSYLSLYRKKQFFLVLLLMTISSVFEIISVGSILPFLGVITAPEQVFNHALMQDAIEVYRQITGLSITSPSQLTLPLTVAFVLSVLSASVIRIILLYAITKLSFAIGADLSVKIYSKTLHQDYLAHVGRNSSEVISTIIRKTNTVVHAILSPILLSISSIVLFVGIISILLIVNTKITLATFTSIGVIYFIIIWATRKKISQNSKIIAVNSNLTIKSLQEGLGGIRDILIDGSQDFYCNIFRKADKSMRRAAGDNLFISGSPRYAMEAIGMSFIAGLAYTMTLRGGNIEQIVPTLGVIALGAQKMLPLLQQFFASFSTIRGAMHSLEDVLVLLDQESSNPLSCLNKKSVQFNKNIKLTNLSYQFKKDSKFILEDINLNIGKGECIGVVGETGSGKSTLIDVIMSLFYPTYGSISVDGVIIDKESARSWQRLIAHVPQNIFLKDGTIEENIAFGIPSNEVCQTRLKSAIKLAQLSNFIDSHKDGCHTIVGEGGSKLSGGQRQRIGIARALYKGVEVLIFDEATSALDSNTEKKVMSAIGGLDKNITIIMIAHRLSTLKNCTRIIKLEGGGISIINNSNNLNPII
jgi:ATP-binding cassette, subfamily B, bacterial PglK